MYKPKGINYIKRIEQPNNPLHEVKLSTMLEYLVEVHGWEALGRKVQINCFRNDPSVKSSLKFLRRLGSQKS